VCILFLWIATPLAAFPDVDAADCVSLEALVASEDAASVQAACSSILGYVAPAPATITYTDNLYTTLTTVSSAYTTTTKDVTATETSVVQEKVIVTVLARMEDAGHEVYKRQELGGLPTSVISSLCNCLGVSRALRPTVTRRTTITIRHSTTTSHGVTITKTVTSTIIVVPITETTTFTSYSTSTPAAASTTSSSAAPTNTIPVSTDGQCSDSESCYGYSGGQCCSKYGYCGSDSGYCGTGCQAAFGMCYVQEYGQCGGTNWAGSTLCVPGTVCTYSDDYYSQCLLPGSSSS